MGKLNLKLALISMTTVYQIAASQWKAPLMTKNVTSGQSVSMTCRDPLEGSLSWFKIPEDRGQQISDDGRRQTDQKGTLHFVYVEVNDTGKYKCGSSIDGIIQLGSPVQLNVKEGDTNGNVPVKLLQSSGDTAANLGEDVTLECIFGGRPVPTVSWFHGNRTLTNADNVPISGGSIIIKQVSAKDTGIYRCSGKNSDGEEYATMNLNVIGPHQTTPPAVQSERTSPHPVPGTDADDVDVPAVYTVIAITSGSCLAFLAVVSSVAVCINHCCLQNGKAEYGLRGQVTERYDQGAYYSTINEDEITNAYERPLRKHTPMYLQPVQAEGDQMTV